MTRTAANANTPHCESCGRENPGHDEGYTSCCNQLVCYGGHEDRYGTEAHFVRACCWAKAEVKFGGPDAIPDGSCRLMDR